MGDEQRDHGSGPAPAAKPGPASTSEDLVAKLRRELTEARHAQLVQRDHIVGIEAEIGRQNAQILTLNAALRKASARAKRLDERKRAQAKRIDGMQAKLGAARKRNAALARRVEELEASRSRPSVARRVVRRLRGTGR